MHEMDAILAAHPFFADMDAGVRGFIAGCGANERFDAGSLIAREGADADRFYLLRHGTLAIELHAPGREPLVVETLHHGDVFGWAALVPPYRWLFEARCLSLCRVVSLDAVCLRQKCETDKALGFELYETMLRVMARQLQAAHMQMLDLYGELDGGAA